MKIIGIDIGTTTISGVVLENKVEGQITTKAEEKLENVKNPFTDLEDDNIQLVDIRLLELAVLSQQNTNGNEYRMQNR